METFNYHISGSIPRDINSHKHKMKKVEVRHCCASFCGISQCTICKLEVSQSLGSLSNISDMRLPKHIPTDISDRYWTESNRPQKLSQ
jgi:hypothetical protein